jgi:hypothetical protein
LHRTAFAAERREILEMKTYMMSADARLNETSALLTTLNSSLSRYASQLRWLLQSIFRANITILNAIIFARFHFDLPMSVCWDQPVSFQDASGRRVPINVGFVNCWEVTISILIPPLMVLADGTNIVFSVRPSQPAQAQTWISCC